ncbi:GNAT family N-acetyltransferase [Microtetraspora niveoalba]|uniref:GNAT family N-acetyltransferase n=1 Tax=Microtetraspora niveoalba TaxID=46175 RepID=UPI000832145E|nr:GNAT family N-acetyltransferase [Microtetraspora niveoalba]
MNEERKTMAGAISYSERVRDGRPWADRVEVIGPGAADAIMSGMRGWAVSAPPDLGEELLARGARVLRHAHVMLCDLKNVEPAEIEAPEGFRFVPCDRTPEELLPAVRAAYPPDHPDRHPGEGDTISEELTPLLEGRLIGKVLPCSLLVVDSGDTVVAGVVVNDFDEIPWVSQVFRHPVEAPPGTGALALRAVQARAVKDGLATLGLAVTHTNPAKRVYDRLGFVVTETSMTVAV